MRHWQSLVPSVICVRPLRCDSITPPSSALFKSFKKYLKSFFFVLWKRDDFTRSPGRQRERSHDPLLSSAGASWSVVMSHRVVGGRGRFEGECALIRDDCRLARSVQSLINTTWSMCENMCVCVCMHEGVWRLRLYTADTCSSGTKERGQCEDSVLFTISISDFLMFLIPHRMGSNTIISTKSQRGQEKLIIPSRLHDFPTRYNDNSLQNN